jgi:hypothetical protein
VVGAGVVGAAVVGAGVVGAAVVGAGVVGAAVVGPGLVGAVAVCVGFAAVLPGFGDDFPELPLDAGDVGSTGVVTVATAGATHDTV